jgi:hypothetical protein
MFDCQKLRKWIPTTEGTWTGAISKYSTVLNYNSPVPVTKIMSDFLNSTAIKDSVCVMETLTCRIIPIYFMLSTEHAWNVVIKQHV